MDLGSLARRVSRDSLARARLPGHWRFLPLLPLDTPPPALARRSRARSPLAAVGGTPLYRSRGLESRFGVGPIHVKDETRNPSASIKDRASSLVVARAMEEGAAVIVAASAGNVGASLACMGASSGTPTVIAVPASAPRAKVARMALYGSRVLLVEAGADECARLGHELARRRGWYDRSTGLNPVTREGKKTCAYEIALDLAFEPPDLVVVPVGNGNVLSGIAKGFCELAAMGLIERAPKLVGVQSTRANAIARAFGSRAPVTPVEASTVAESICVEAPRDASGAMAALEATAGFMLEVTDRQILEAMAILGGCEGVLAEPAGAAPVAGLARLVEEGRLKRDRSIVLVVTGRGLDDSDAALAACPRAAVVAGSIPALEAAVAADPHLAPSSGGGAR
jgi:threonine synthase